MNRSAVIIAFGLVAIVAAPLAIASKRMANAEAALVAARGSYEAVRRDAQEVLELRSRQQVMNATARPAQDVITLVNAVLAETGIPANRLRSLSPESDSTVTPASGASGQDQVQYKRQTLRLTLENLTVQEIGAFLVQWKQSQQVWTPGRIELTHVRKQNENRYDATILLSAIYIAPPPPPPPSASER